MGQYVELSRLVNLDRLYKKKLSYTVKTTAEEAAALSQRFGIVKINKLEADYKVEAGRTAYRGYYITAHLQAQVIQSCVVTLKEVTEDIDCDFSFHAIDQKYKDEPFTDQDWEEDIKFTVEDVADFGEISAQYLSLSLNPYPRSLENINQELKELDNLTSSKKPNPFEILKSLKP